ncbi:MAG TPA: FHA domain-containing protein, partial [Anaerolineae bacterium]|nr:FHA domain-containing protein [Anaerolineae bacterium]
FCDNCGAQLPAVQPAAPAAPPVQPVTPPPVQPAAPPPAPAAPVGAMVKCPVCGADQPAGQAFCDACGASLAAAQPAVAPPVTPAAPPVAPPPIVGVRPRLVVAGTGAEFDLSGKAEVLVGREDPVSGVFPDVDLTPHGGEEGGVSRRHAKITMSGNQWLIEDLNSTNFTFVNNQKLNPGMPQPLNDGDQIRLGRVVLTFQTS